MKFSPGFKVTLIYFAIGMLWIYLSDRFLFVFFDFKDESRHIMFQNVKGFFYISITALLLFKLISSFYKVQEKRLNELEQKQNELDQVQKITSSGTWEYDFVNKTTVWSDLAKEIFELGDIPLPVTGRILDEMILLSSSREKLFKAFTEAEQEGREFDLQLEVTTANGNDRWIRFSGKPHMVNGACTRIYGSFQDITNDILIDVKLRKLNRLYDFITQVNRVIVREKDELAMFRDICEIAVSTGNFHMAWIGLVNAESQQLDACAFAGNESGYLSVIRKITLKDEPEGKGPTGSALRLGTHFVCNDIAADPRVAPWRESQLERGYRSSIALPIFKFGDVAGAFTLYAPAANFFDNEEVELLKDATADISHAFEKLATEQLRRSAEARVLEALDRYDMISMATSDTIWDWDVNSETVYYNKGIHTVFGYGREQVQHSVRWREMNIHPNDRASVRKSIEDVFVLQEQKFHTSYRFKCADGRFKIVSDRFFIRYDDAGKPVRVIGTMQDITQEKEYEQRVDNAIVRTQEAERQQVGMELHDNVNQILAASLIYLGVAKDDLSRGKDVSNDIALSEQYTREAVTEIRRLSHQLAPVSLKDISIREAFEKLLSTVNSKNLFKVKLNLELLPKELMTNELKINLYRILQEQINNIVKYAKATEVTITLTLHQGVISFSIYDNGRGFDTNTKSTGIGMENIRRRANLLSGEFRLNSAPGEGCEIEVDIPVFESEKRQEELV